jgi:hypothetical protein
VICPLLYSEHVSPCWIKLPRPSMPALSRFVGGNRPANAM